MLTILTRRIKLLFENVTVAGKAGVVLASATFLGVASSVMAVAQDGPLLATIPAASVANVSFSPDGKLVA